MWIVFQVELPLRPVSNSSGQFVYGNQNTRTSVTGVTPEYAVVRNDKVVEGEFITAAQLNARSQVVVLGHSTAETWFGDVGLSVGKTVRINGQPFRVVGVLESKGSSGFGSQDDVGLIPLTTAQARLTGVTRVSGGQRSVSMIYAQASSSDRVDAAEEDMSRWWAASAS